MLPGILGYHYPKRVAKGTALTVPEYVVHAAEHRMSGPTHTACGRTLWNPLELARETSVSCAQCNRFIERWVREHA